jgi:hypothetical protein
MVDELSKAIRQDPLAYLPEVSLDSLWHFRRGYGFRMTAESKSQDWSDGNDKVFAEWVRAHFQVQGGRAISHFALISAFFEERTRGVRQLL